MNKEQYELLRKPFPKEAIHQLPTGGKNLDYVGHAWVTDRLLEVDPDWTWEPVAFDQETGLPKLDANGGLWIKLTVCGITRYGYGEPQGRDEFDRIKGAIGNALRVAGMRFGIALDLWKKDVPVTTPVKTTSNMPAVAKIVERIAMAGSLVELAEIVPIIRSTDLNLDEKNYLKQIYDEKAGELS